eukprot:2936018-Rhodomonas_salina.1
MGQALWQLSVCLDRAKPPFPMCLALARSSSLTVSPILESGSPVLRLEGGWQQGVTAAQDSRKSCNRTPLDLERQSRTFTLRHKPFLLSSHACVHQLALSSARESERIRR